MAMFDAEKYLKGYITKLEKSYSNQNTCFTIYLNFFLEYF